MIERKERKIELGLMRKPESVVDEIERIALEMRGEGWYYLRSHTDQDLREVLLFFERELDVK